MTMQPPQGFRSTLDLLRDAWGHDYDITRIPQGFRAAHRDTKATLAAGTAPDLWDQLRARHLPLLAAQHPAWRIATIATTTTGPNRANLTAQRGGILLTAPGPAQLTAKIAHEQTRHPHWGDTP